MSIVSGSLRIVSSFENAAENFVDRTSASSHSMTIKLHTLYIVTMEPGYYQFNKLIYYIYDLQLAERINLPLFSTVLPSKICC